MPHFSFEFFPPKTEAAEQKLWHAIERLAPLKPDFVSVTYGAGGTTRTRTHDCVRRIKQETTLLPAAHLTCVGAQKSDIDAIIHDYKEAGIDHIVALRGDMPDMQSFTPHPQGYASAVDLVAALSTQGISDISVAVYPEPHPDSTSLSADIDVLKAKIDAGAKRAITQFCFDTDALLHWHDQIRKNGIEIPIIPGIMPSTNFTGIKKMAAACGATIPNKIAACYDGLNDEADTRKHIAATIALDQCRILFREGFEALHFYTLNQADLTFAICRILQNEENL